ncbi:MAG: hypothetical protein JWO82_2375 [Akkermansiaceae bacterium]|nr:hypothetical protein [Akkermansiaceae bacterium]
MKHRLTPKNPPPSQHRKKWVAAAAVAALLTTGIFLLPVGKQTLTGTRDDSSSKASARAGLIAQQEAEKAAELKRLAELIELGKKAIPTAGADLAGPPVRSIVPDRELTASGWKKDPDPAMKAFANTAEAYLRAPTSVKASLESGLVASATARLAVLETQISTDPRRALANAVPMAVRDQLPASVQSQLEKRVDGFGDLSVLNSMAVPGADPIAPSDLVAVGDQSYEAHRYGDRENIPWFRDTSVHGIVAGNKMAVLDSPVRVLEEGEKIEGSVVNETCPVSGNTVATAGVGTVQAGNKTLFQVGSSFFETCDPAHVTNVESGIVASEKANEPTGQTLASLGLHALCMPKPQALGDSAAPGTAGSLGKPPTTMTFGGKKILIMRVQASDTGFPTNGTPTDFNNMVFGSGGFDTRIRRISYNNTWISQSDVTPVMTLPQPRTYYVGNPLGTAYDCNRWITDAKAAAVAQGYVLSNYAQLIVAHESYNTGAAGLAWAGYIFLNGYFGVEVTLHEYGHTFRLPHANSWYTTDGNPISTGKQHREYGDAADPMGNAWGANQYNSFNPYFKNICSWIPDTAVQTITRNGTYRVYQHDGTGSLSRTVALKLGRDNEFNYWISIYGDPIAQGNFNSGAAVYAVSSYKFSDTHLLDMNNPGDDNRDNAPLAVNQSWYDAASDITIKTVAVGGSAPDHYADIQVTFGPKNTADYRPLVSGGVYRFKNRSNGLYLGLAGNTATNATPLTAAAATGTAAENWVAWRQTDGSYRFNHRGTDKWMDVQSNSLADGAEIWQYTTSTGDSQKWYIAQNPDGYLIFVHKGTDGKVIDMDPSGVNDVHQWGSAEYTWQSWYPELVGMSPGTYRIFPRHAQGQCLDITGGGTGNGPAAELYTWNASANQKFTLSDIDTGRVRLTPTSDTSTALDISSSGTANGTRIQQWGWINNTNAAQRWVFSRTDGNWCRFTPDCATSSCMEVSGDDNAFGNGSVVQLWQFTGALDQQWRFADPD